MNDINNQVDYWNGVAWTKELQSDERNQQRYEQHVSELGTSTSKRWTKPRWTR
jgi:hypothetical protein